MGTFTRKATTGLVLLIILVVTCKGLEFSLTYPTSALSGFGGPCGVLLCKENKSDSTKSKNLGKITKMTVLKTVTTKLGSIDRTEPTRLTSLATLSATQPNLDQVYDGMKLRGLLEDGQATLRIELSKQNDCLAEYTCELTEVNVQGERMVTSHRLLQRPEQKKIPKMPDSSLTSMMMMKLFTLAQEQNVKLEVMANILQRQENSFQLQFRGINDKVCELDSKLSAIDSEAIQEKVLGTIKAQIDNHFSKVLNASEQMNYTLSKTATLLTSLNSQNTEFQNNIMENYQTLFSNVTRGMDDVFTRNKNLTDTLENNLVSFREDVDLSWRSFESKTNRSTTNTLNALEEVVVNLNATLVGNKGSVVKDLFQPETCEKDKPVLLHHPLTPYPVIYRSGIVGLDGPILCDTTTDEGGWIIIQRRSTGHVDFYRDWASYRDGFGDFRDDFWLGNEKIHRITSSGRYELRVELKYQGKSAYALYDRFSLAGEEKNYALTRGSYSGTAGNSISATINNDFSTYDRDNDRSSSNCAQVYSGAWWYTNCHNSNLNGKWGQNDNKGPRWLTFTGSNSVSFSEMKIRRVVE